MVAFQRVQTGKFINGILQKQHQCFFLLIKSWNIEFRVVISNISEAISQAFVKSVKQEKENFNDVIITYLHWQFAWSKKESAPWWGHRLMSANRCMGSGRDK
jgi:hypothetical protein